MSDDRTLIANYHLTITIIRHRIAAEASHYHRSTSRDPPSACVLMAMQSNSSSRPHCPGEKRSTVAPRQLHLSQNSTSNSIHGPSSARASDRRASLSHFCPRRLTATRLTVARLTSARLLASSPARLRADGDGSANAAGVDAPSPPPPARAPPTAQLLHRPGPRRAAPSANRRSSGGGAQWAFSAS